MTLLKTLVLVIVLIAMFGVGSILYEHDIEENGKLNDTFRFQIEWNSTDYQQYIEENTYPEEYNISKINGIRLRNVIYKTIDWMGYILFELANWGVEFGYVHGEDINYNTLIDWLPRIIILIMVFVAFPAIVPLIALIYLLCVGIKKGYIKIKNRVCK